MVSVKRILQNSTLRATVAPTTDFGSQPIDDQDGFGPIRSTHTPTMDAGAQLGERKDQENLISTCVDAIASASHLRLQLGVTLRDDFLVRAIVDCEDDAVFQDLLDPFIVHIQHQRVRITSANLDSLLDRLEQPLVSYMHGTSDAFHVLTARLLNATMHIWLEESLPKDVRDKILLVYEWLAEHFINGKLHWWETRDAVRRLCSSYLVADPLQTFMAGVRSENLPNNIILLFLEDDDIRVRFGGAEAFGHLFESDYVQTRVPMAIYSDIRDRLCKVLRKYVERCFIAAAMVTELPTAMNTC